MRVRWKVQVQDHMTGIYHWIGVVEVKTRIPNNILGKERYIRFQAVGKTGFTPTQVAGRILFYVFHPVAASLLSQVGGGFFFISCDLSS